MPSWDILTIFMMCKSLPVVYSRGIASHYDWNLILEFVGEFYFVLALDVAVDGDNKAYNALSKCNVPNFLARIISISILFYLI